MQRPARRMKCGASERPDADELRQIAPALPARKRFWWCRFGCWTLLPAKIGLVVSIQIPYNHEWPIDVGALQPKAGRQEVSVGSNQGSELDELRSVQPVPSGSRAGLIKSSAGRDALMPVLRRQPAQLCSVTEREAARLSSVGICVYGLWPSDEHDAMEDQLKSLRFSTSTDAHFENRSRSCLTSVMRANRMRETKRGGQTRSTDCCTVNAS
ncbi:hypothetical protein PHSY_003455 [Pseudozyma hubeiensis SY62]|uniref:Uncharacterized protein n=1 Tax=Pseudozyma hubeiensis (strain SY62) TaxID=1305764 RepID=R9P3S0_PSEHS|nr:hypothetical protein PHSY_003455 [Pseudozyma hubeiensis SY62]GAC95877.1 hypothetical protein PHSY_003455 [Pseudozyma hubeiensis SY62]